MLSADRLRTATLAPPVMSPADQGEGWMNRVMVNLALALIVLARQCIASLVRVVACHVLVPVQGMDLRTSAIVI